MLRRRTVLRRTSVGLATGATAALAGCPGQDQDTTALAIEHVRFVADRPTGHREYEEVPEATYERDDVVWIYFEPVGLAGESVDGGERIQLSTTLTTTWPDGSETVLEDSVDRTVGEDESSDSVYLFWQFDPNDPVLPGEYEAEITVTDELAEGKTTAATERFVLGTADVDDPHVAGIRMDLQERLDAEVQSVGRDDGALAVEYDSGHAIDTRASGEEVGYVVGRYTAYVATGLETDELVATVHAADGDYRYRFSSERARAWANGEVTNDEVVTGIYENMEEL